MSEERLEMSKLTPEGKEVQHEASVRLESQVYVWDGTKGVFLKPETFIELKKRFPCTVQDVKGVTVAALTDLVKEPNWEEIHGLRMKDSQGQLAYFEKVALFRRHDKGIAKAYLVTYYERGKFVDELLAQPGKYGNRSVKQFAEDLGVSESSVYLYQRFASLYKDQRVLEMTSKEMSWSLVTQLLSLHSEKERSKLEDAYLGGKLDERQMAQAIKKAKRAEAEKKPASGEKKDRRGGPGLSRLFDSTKVFADKFLEKLSEFSEGHKAFNKLPDDDRKKELRAKLKAAAGSLNGVYRRLDKLMGAAEKPKEAGSPLAGLGAKKEG